MPAPARQHLGQHLDDDDGQDDGGGGVTGRVVTCSAPPQGPRAAAESPAK